MNVQKIVIAAGGVFFAVQLAVSASGKADALESGFLNPPDSAKPHTWYHMMNGNVTKEGITRDFEEIAKAGLGGVQMFDAGCAVPPGPVKFNSHEWYELLSHAHREAKRLGLEMCIPNCSGWSSSGGPWNPPENAMKWLVTTETNVKGPQVRWRATLPREKKDNGFYEDIAVIAYPTPESGAGLTDFDFKRGRLRKKGPLVRDAGKFAPGQIVDKGREIDLTAQMKSDGTIEWNVPEGDWTVLRIGFICNGRCNHPASEKGRGLEVDKLSAKAMDYHFAQYVGRLCGVLGVGRHTDNRTGFNNILVDSYEVGCQDWTQGLEKIFEDRLGYSIMPYLPVFAGRIVGSADETERFLEDFRRLLADLFAENYAGRLVKLCHENGLLCSIEPYGSSNADDLQYGQDVDIPMSEFWSTAASGPHAKVSNTLNSRHAAYIGHVWGRRYIGAEAFTASPNGGGRWQTTPFSIKAKGDRVYAEGVNRMIYHRFTHQPWADDRYLPGMTMGRWGMHLDRTQTWWHIAPEFLRYQSRCQWMLQEGRFAADVLFWQGEAAPNAQVNYAMILKGRNALPDGYAWDFCASKAVEKLTVRNGRIVVPGGVEYSVLVLPETDSMSERMVRRIGELLKAGAKVVAPCRPVRTSGLSGGADADMRLRRAVAEVWSYGVEESSVADALVKFGIKPDVQGCPADAAWIHRRNGFADWYFIARNNETNVSFEVSFRMKGRIPEIWNPETGAMRPAPVWREADDRTFVTLDFKPSGSAFVVFRDKAASARPHIVSATVKVDGSRGRSEVPGIAHTLAIRKAEYGVFPESIRPDCMNVKPKIKAGVKITVNKATMGGDPVYRERKQLEVVYMLRGRKHRKLIAEHASYTLPRDAELLSAWYGKIDSGWSAPKNPVVDVTAKVAAAVKDGEISIRIDNGLVGRDPVFKTRKSARIEYEYDGQLGKAEVMENEMFSIPKHKCHIQPKPEWEWFDGKILAWQPLTAEVEWSDGVKRAFAASPRPPVFVDGPWTVSFPKGWDAPEKTEFPRLESWTQSGNPGIRYFSGTARYSKSIRIPVPKKGERVMLDLGVVKEFAEVAVNGKAYPPLWRPPFRIDVTDVANEGRLDLEIRITNLWPNRLIGDDALYPADCEWRRIVRGRGVEYGIKEIPAWVKEGGKSPAGRHTFTTWRHWSKDDDLLPSGLIGPVCIRYGSL